MPDHPRLLSFLCHCCGEQVVEDHPIGWQSLYCTPCINKGLSEVQKREHLFLPDSSRPS